MGAAVNGVLATSYLSRKMVVAVALLDCRTKGIRNGRAGNLRDARHQHRLAPASSESAHLERSLLPRIERHRHQSRGAPPTQRCESNHHTPRNIARAIEAD